MSTASAIPSYQHWIGGAPDQSPGARLERRNPADDSLVSSYAAGTAADTDRAVAAARASFESGVWSRISGAQRAGLLTRAAAAIRRDAPRLARLETLESGKPISQATAEMEWSAALWDYAAGLARDLSGTTHNQLGDSHLGLTLREPAGVAALVTPWNFPLLIVSQKLPFALAAGCSVVVKPSELTSATTLELARLLEEVGLPAGVCNVVTGLGGVVGQRLAEHDDVDVISFTGSTAVGQRIVAASAGNLKRVALELGGKNPQIVFPDADLDAALNAIVLGGYFNAGECCNSGSRVLLHRDISDDFVAALAERARALPVGDPMDPATKVGAIIERRQFDKILGHIATGREQGARLCAGGQAVARGSGLFIAPTVFDRVAPEMRMAREEIFGPVISVLRFSDEAEAARIANSTAYGLSASIWSRDFDRVTSLARRVRAGTVWINCFLDGFPEVPFGGYRQSGWGRELGRGAVEHFCETKSVVARLGAPGGAWDRG